MKVAATSSVSLLSPSLLTYKLDGLRVVLVEGVCDDAGVGEGEGGDEALGEGGRQGLGRGAAQAAAQRGGAQQHHQQSGGHGWGRDLWARRTRLGLFGLGCLAKATVFGSLGLDHSAWMTWRRSLQRNLPWLI